MWLKKCRFHNRLRFRIYVNIFCIVAPEKNLQNIHKDAKQFLPGLQRRKHLQLDYFSICYGFASLYFLIFVLGTQTHQLNFKSPLYRFVCPPPLTGLFLDSKIRQKQKIYSKPQCVIKAFLTISLKHLLTSSIAHWEIALIGSSWCRLYM